MIPLGHGIFAIVDEIDLMPALLSGSTGHKHIYFHAGGFRVEIKRQTGNLRKLCRTLSEALRVRDEYLK